MPNDTLSGGKHPFVVYWNNIPAPYMVDRFNALADHGSIEFEAWFNERLTPDRSWDVDESSWRFRYRYLPSISVMGRCFYWPAPLLGRRPDVLVSLYSGASFVVGRMLASLRGIRVCYRVLKTHDTWVRRHPAKEALKRILFKNVAGVETPGGDGKRYAMKYGVPSERVHIATHTVDIERYKVHSQSALGDRDALRRDMGVKGTVFIYVGRLWHGKGLNHLLRAFAEVQRMCRSEVSLLLVGDGAEEDSLKHYCQERAVDNVVFAGFKQKDELLNCYVASDVFVFPTLGDPYGIVVDEAMACSLPVISTDAAGEISERIEDGVNGYVIKSGDVEAMTQRMLQLADEPETRKRMGGISRERISRNTPERWAQDFEAMINCVRGN